MKPIHILAAILISTCAAGTAFADKTDVVLLINGNAITGEVKSMDFGALSYKTDSMGTVTIDWEDVVGVTSKQTLQVEVTDGTRYFGHLNTSDDRFRISVITLTETVTLPTSKVVRMTPIDTDDPFLERLDGSFSLGFTTQKSSDVTTLNIATDVRYRTRKYALDLNANATYTAQTAAPASKRANVGFTYLRFRPNRWFTQWYTNWEQNDELGIESRYVGGVGYGRYFVQSNNYQFSLALGVNATRELYTGDTDPSTEAEGLISVKFLHRRLTPDANMTLTSNIYPLLSDFSHVRGETDISFRREIISDLYLDFTIYQSFNTDPPPDAASTDYGATTSIGYSW